MIRSPHIYIALATGISIVVMAYLSKRVLPRPLGYLDRAIPPFLATVFESVYSKHKDKRICTPWYWVASIFVASAIVIIIHLY